MEMVDGMHAGQSRWVDRMSEYFQNARWYTDDTRSHHRLRAQLWVGSTRNWLAFLERP